MTEKNTGGNPPAPAHQLLNELIGAFWSASIQHQTHLALISALGLTNLSNQMQAHISDEPLTLKTLTDRLLDIGGTPEFTVAQPRIGHTLRSILEADLQVQEAGLPVLNQAIETLVALRDATTRRMIEDVLVGEEAHLSWLKNELSLLDRLGESLYLSVRVSATPA
ncbi:ferritin-like domain-containing protein [Uliginosibacterium aquaticum]|uniref:Bacterioferritin n=1 Tax=Uliginosibacterium aquaticum TaxID=2731212 RepID=A0ABX2IE82_9RHOO|nr:ferritin-like domain-containing protein [Uliginosibacterium aquaticum]NSL54929.1 bacterioferritin [Uliginosibacterium aquaticum]